MQVSRKVGLPTVWNATDRGEELEGTANRLQSRGNLFWQGKEVSFIFSGKLRTQFSYVYTKYEK